MPIPPTGLLSLNHTEDPLEDLISTPFADEAVPSDLSAACAPSDVRGDNAYGQYLHQPLLLPPSYSVFHDVDQPHVVDSAIIDDIMAQPSDPSHLGSRAATTDCMDAPSTLAGGSEPTAYDRFSTDSIYQNATPLETSPMSCVTMAESPTTGPSGTPDNERKRKSSPPAKSRKNIKKKTRQVASFASTSASPAASSCLSPVPPRTPSTKRNVGRRRKRPSAIEVEPIVDEIVNQVEKEVGPADMAAVESVFNQHVARAAGKAEDRKIEERMRLRNCPAKDGAKNASRIEARLSRYRKDEFILSLQGELKDALKKLDVMHRSHARATARHDGGLAMEVWEAKQDDEVGN